jgi:hypothetical protein
MQGIGKQLLAHLGTVRIRGVEELHSEIEGSAENILRGSRIRRFTPAARAGQRHRSIADAAHGHVAADREGRGRQVSRA